jgi:hypothetical protein
MRVSYVTNGNYRALLQKMTYKDEASYASTPHGITKMIAYAIHASHMRWLGLVGSLKT